MPLTRLSVQDETVRVEIPTGATLLQAPAALQDQEVQHLLHIESKNHVFCDMLTANGYDGSQLRLFAPRRSIFVDVTAPQSGERVQALKDCKTAGQHFHIAGGSHHNTDAFFRAEALKEKVQAIKEMEDAKAKRPELSKFQQWAVNTIRKSREPSFAKQKSFNATDLKDLLEWKIGKRSCEEDGSTKKEDLLQAVMNIPKPKIYVKWTPSEEAGLQKLKEEMVPLRDTAIGTTTAHFSRAAANNVDHLDTPAKAALRAALGPKQEEDVPFDV